MPAALSPGGYSQGNAGSTGKSLQAPIKGLNRAMGTTDVPAVPPDVEEGVTMPDRSLLGQRTESEAMGALMDAMRRIGRVY